MRRLLALLGCVVPVALLALAAPAGADVFGPISLVSRGTLGGGEPEQAEYAHDPVISGNGQYLAYDGSIGGVSGVWRRDLATGAIEQVAGGDAELPSIDASGQFVSFTTNEGASLAQITDRHVHVTKQEAVNVYVRDMSRGPSEPGAFKVVSAVNGSEEPLTYIAGTFPTKEGSAAAGRSAISADGNEVAFVTTAVSNLVPDPKSEEEEKAKGETPKPHTPKLQVAVRYLDKNETVLVSRCYVHCEPNAEPAVGKVENNEAYGAVYPGESALFKPPPAYGEFGASPPPGASISADGSTVAWMGEDISQQAVLLPEEFPPPHYTEPLWRRIEPGSETSTERVTGGSDPNNPACMASGERKLPATPSPSDPCQGPFAVEEESLLSGIWNADGGQIGDFVPRLSADGYTVAFISEAPLVSAGGNFGRPRTGQASDLYIANMRPGLTRDQALTQLTELAGGENAGLADTAPIVDFDISPDGSQVAFATVRTRFPLGSPAFVSTPAGEPGMNELFDADLPDDTLTRVTHGYQGPDEAGEHAHKPAPAGDDPYQEQSGDGALSPSFPEDGNVLAFSSTASNLVFGDGNAPPLGSPLEGSFDGSDAFVVSRTLFGATPTPNEASRAPEPAFEPLWNIGVTALSQADGSVLLYVEAPGSGAIYAGARGAVVVEKRSTRTTRHAHRASAPRTPARAHKKLSENSAITSQGALQRDLRSFRTVSKSKTVAPAVATRTVATRVVDTHGAGLTMLTLTLDARHASLAHERGGFSAIVTVTFTARGHTPLRDSIPVTFVRKAAHAQAGSRKRRHKGSSSKRRERR